MRSVGIHTSSSAWYEQGEMALALSEFHPARTTVTSRTVWLLPCRYSNIELLPQSSHTPKCAKC